LSEVPVLLKARNLQIVSLFQILQTIINFYVPDSKHFLVMHNHLIILSFPLKSAHQGNNNNIMLLGKMPLE